MRYVIYGAGAIGGAIGARLFEAGREVLLIARGAHLEALRRDGLRYGDPERTRVLPIPAVGHPSEVDWRDDDVVVLAMKAQATEDAIRELEAVAPPSIAVVCAQNGLENERMALRRFANVYGMVVMMPATHIEPGAVDADSFPVVGVLDVGRYPSGTDDVITRVAADLTASGFRSDADPDVMRWKHEKLLANLTTAFRAACGLESDDDADAAALRSTLYAALRDETLACYAAAGLNRPTDEERAERWSVLSQRPIPGRPRGAGSGWQSMMRQTGNVETDYVNGEVVLLGRLHGVPTPVNDALRRLSNDAARRRQAPGSVAVADVAAAAGVVASAT